MIDQEAVGLRVQAYNMHQQDRSRSPEQRYDFLTASGQDAAVLHLVQVPPYEPGDPA